MLHLLAEVLVHDVVEVELREGLPGPLLVVLEESNFIEGLRPAMILSCMSRAVVTIFPTTGLEAALTLGKER